MTRSPRRDSLVPRPSADGAHADALPTLLEERLAAVRARIAAACAAAGRDPRAVTLVAVTKSAGAAAAAELCALGQIDLGESRVQELARKSEALAARGCTPRWHLLGHLQRNKARRAVELASEIHSVDSTRLLRALSRHALELRRTVGVYLEVELTELPGRTGFHPEALPEAVAEAAGTPGIRLLGLMTLAPPPGVPRERIRGTFRRLDRLREDLPQGAFVGGRARLSMGMSSDFEDAIAEGADVVRVGSALLEGLPGEGAEPRP